MSWPKGVSKPKPPNAGRKKGTPNKATFEIKTFARSIFEDPTYQRKLKARIAAGTAHRMEELLAYYAYGRPSQDIKVSGTLTLDQLVTGQGIT